MNIRFVSVEDAFRGHEAYTSDPYINEIMWISRSQDLKISVTSAYSMHPNAKGAQAYAMCVQDAIDEIEATRSSTPEPDKNNDNPFYTFLKSSYDSADKYTNGLPVFYNLDGNNKKKPDDGVIWKDYIIDDFDGDGTDELLIRASFYTHKITSESGDIFYIYEAVNGKVTLSNYSFVDLGYKYDDDMTVFYNNAVIYDEREETCLNLYLFSEKMRKKYNLSAGQYLKYVSVIDPNTGEISKFERQICSTFAVEKTDVITSEQYAKETDSILNGKFLNVSIYPLTTDGIEKSK